MEKYGLHNISVMPGKKVLEYKHKCSIYGLVSMHMEIQISDYI